MDFSQGYHYEFPKILSEPLNFRNLHQKYMRPTLDNNTRLYYPMAEKPFWTFMRYNPIHLMFFFTRMMFRLRRVRRATRRSKYYLHMFGLKRRGTAKVDYRVRFNNARRPRPQNKKNNLARAMMQYTNRALLLSFIMEWRWALGAAFALSFLNKNRRSREARIKQRLLFAPRRMVLGEQFTLGTFLRLKRFPKRLYQRIHFKNRHKPFFKMAFRRMVMYFFALTIIWTRRPFSASKNDEGHVAKNRRGVPQNVRKFLRDYTHPFQINEYNQPMAWQVLNANVWQSYQARRARYGQLPSVTLTEWKGHNVNAPSFVALGE